MTALTLHSLPLYIWCAFILGLALTAVHEKQPEVKPNETYGWAVPLGMGTILFVTILFSWLAFKP